MSDEGYVYATAGLMALTFVLSVATKRFDPFAPVWLFFVGYFHLYVIQAITLREWAVGVRGVDLVAAANCRAFWALLWMLAVYYSGLGKVLARGLPTPPRAWSPVAVSAVAPPMLVWGLYCAFGVLTQVMGEATELATPEETLFRSFPFLMVVAGALFLITSRDGARTRPAFLALGLGVCVAYVFIWMFNGKRSPSLMGVMVTVCGYYAARRRRPSWAVLLTTAFAGAAVVALAIGWRNNVNYERSAVGFVQYLGDFQVGSILKSLNVEEDEDVPKPNTYETLEYGGFLLMMDTVPEKSDYDYGANYLRCVSTFIPRVVWQDKPLYGRDQWIGAWRAGSEMKRDEKFTGPSIGIMGATQLNGGAVGTLIVMGVVGLMLSTGYEFFRLHEALPWAQAFWALTFYNAWFMTAADDPMNWFYYNYGFTCMPCLVVLWVVNKLAPNPAPGTSPATPDGGVAYRPAGA